MNEQPSEPDNATLNALVAERVMGLDPNRPCTGTWVPLDPEPDGLYCTGCGAQIGWGTTPWDKYHGRPQPECYASDMNAAWKVMEAMTAIEMEDLGNEEKRKKRERFDDALTNVIGPLARGTYTYALVAYHVAKLTPRIICIAALQACGVDI